jgi:hypothetical protein
MKEGSTDSSQSTGNEYRFSLKRGHIAAPLNTLVHASGRVVRRHMMCAGLCLNLAAIIVITLLFHLGVAG